MPTQKEKEKSDSTEATTDKKTPKSEENHSSHVRPGFRRIARLQKKEEFLPSFTKSFVSFIFEVLKVVVISLVIIIPIRYFLIQPFYVRGASMEPNFYDNEYLIINEISYRFSDPDRGDVVVIREKKDVDDYLIKRIIALPNEKVQIMGGVVNIFNDENPEGIILEENYLKKNIFTSGNSTTTLKDQEYFVMGDNRSSSLDSRSFGPIIKDDIVGRAWIRAWPLYKATYFTSPIYNF